MKVKLNPAIEGMSGQLGDLVFREVNGKTVVSRKAVNNAEPTPEQLVHRERFRQAVAYGKGAMANPVIRPQYEEIAQRRNLPVFSTMVADFFNPPIIGNVDLTGYNGEIGDTINIHVTDDFLVEHVYVSVKDPQDNPIENGQAVRSAPGSDLWIFTASIQNQPLAKFQIVAMDRPGGTTVLNLEKTA